MPKEGHGVSFGKDLGLVHEVIITGRKACRDQLRFFLSILAHHENIFQEVFDFTLNKAGTLPLYKVTVDYQLSFEEMVEVGEYDSITDTINPKDFPVKGEGKTEVKIALLEFDHNIKCGEVTTEFEKRGFRPATIEELLALGAQYPYLQMRFKEGIVALGSVHKYEWGDCGLYEYWMSCLSSSEEKRCLGYRISEKDEWLAKPEIRRFAAVPL